MNFEVYSALSNYVLNVVVGGGKSFIWGREFSPSANVQMHF